MIMTELMFEEYENGFNNAAGKSDFFDRWYHPDAEFIHPIKGIFKGKEQMAGFWNCGRNSGHAGIDVFHGKCAAFYTFRGDKIARVQIYLNCF